MDVPDISFGNIITEKCRYISATNRWYTLTYERPYYDGMPERSKHFPSVLREKDRKNDYLIIAEYIDGTREAFMGFSEIEFRFSAKQIEMIEDVYNQELVN